MKILLSPTHLGSVLRALCEMSNSESDDIELTVSGILVILFRCSLSSVNLLRDEIQAGSSVSVLLNASRTCKLTNSLIDSGKAVNLHPLRSIHLRLTSTPASETNDEQRWITGQHNHLRKWETKRTQIGNSCPWVGRYRQTLKIDERGKPRWGRTHLVLSNPQQLQIGAVR